MMARVGSTGGMNGSSTSGAPLRHLEPVRCTVAEPVVPAVPTVPDVDREGSVGLSAGVVMKEIGVFSRPASTGAG
jgi:hypothetical protein